MTCLMTSSNSSEDRRNLLTSLITSEPTEASVQISPCGYISSKLLQLEPKESEKDCRRVSSCRLMEVWIRKEPSTLYRYHFHVIDQSIPTEMNHLLLKGPTWPMLQNLFWAQCGRYSFSLDMRESTHTTLKCWQEPSWRLLWASIKRLKMWNRGTSLINTANQRAGQRFTCIHFN